jgi:hypothetical protein
LLVLRYSTKAASALMAQSAGAASIDIEQLVDAAEECRRAGGADADVAHDEHTEAFVQAVTSCTAAADVEVVTSCIL